jgi:ribulose-5-phosphate 4-epimerase/fuculose-1-phosphate aldolase
MNVAAVADPGLDLDSSLEKVAVGHRILAMEGHNDITLGHLSFRDPKGRGLWLKKSQRGLDEVFGRSDFVLIDFEGNQLEQAGQCHSEWPIHTEIMRARPDVNVVGHTHAYYSVLFSAAEEELCALNHEGANLLGNLARFRETAGLINTQPLGRSLAESLGQMSVVLMKNHGITFVGSSVEEATLYGMFIERACKAQIEIAATGWKWSTPSGAGYDRKMGGPAAAYHRTFFDYFARKLARAEARG